MSNYASKTTNATTQLHNTTNHWMQERATIYTGDIRSPWKSVYGFPVTAARLAPGQELVLHCREDEVFDYLAQLNQLLESPESLNRAYQLLEALAQMTHQKFIHLVQLQDQSISTNEIPDLLGEVEEILAGNVEDTLASRLACFLSPDDPIQEIVGVRKMLLRLRRVMAGLDKVKHQGFKVAVIDRRRKPLRPGGSVPVEGQPGELPGTFRFPPQYHLTLWAYLVAKSDARQSTVWN